MWDTTRAAVLQRLDAGHRFGAPDGTWPFRGRGLRIPTLAEVLDAIPRKGARMILYAAYQDKRPAEFVAAKSGLPAVMLPFTVGGTDKANDLFGFFEDTVNRLLAAAGKAP